MSGLKSSIPSGPRFPLVVSSTSPNAAGCRILLAGDGDQAVASSTLVPASNQTVYVPFWLDRQMTAYKMFVGNGGTAAGTIHVGIYSSSWARLVTASAAQSGTNANQYFDIADTVLGPGWYAMAVGSTDGTSTGLVWTNLNDLQRTQHLYYTQASLMPATAVPVLPAGNNIPNFGILFDASVPNI